MATVSLPRPIVPHRASSGIATLGAPLTFESLPTSHQPQPRCSTPPSTSSSSPPPSATTPIPNKHLPACPTGPARTQDWTTPPPSPDRVDESRRASLLHPPEDYTRLDKDDLAIYSIGAAHVAAALDHISREPLPDPSSVFPWFHGLHPLNHIQQAFFLARKRASKSIPNCLRGITVVKADGDLSASRLKGAVAPSEFLRAGTEGDFLDADPKEGFSVRNFQIQTVKAATTSDLVVYGEDASTVRRVGWQAARAQQKWKAKQEKLGHSVPEYNTFICTSSFAEFEERYGDIVAVSSSSHMTGSVVDFQLQERAEMYAMARASEISHNVFLGPTPDDAEDFDILIECADLAKMDPASLQAIAEGPDEGEDVKFSQLEFPSSGSIPPPTWSHADADGILETCKWIWHLAHGTLPARVDTDTDGDLNMSDGSEATLRGGRPRKILIHCGDGYTESTMLAIAYFSYSTGRSVPDAWLDLHTVKKRNFFAYPTDVALLTSLAPRLLSESPACSKGLSEITSMVKDEPRWFASLDGSLPSRILDYMYLGNLGHANNSDLLRALGIGQILSVGETAMWRDGELQQWGEDNVYVVEDVQDNGIDPLTEHLEKCLDFIERGRRNGTATLVHCRVGVSRSATICIAEVMRTLDVSFPRAYCLVRARRLNVIIQPHLRFAYELLKWEEHLQGQHEAENASDASGIKRESEWNEIAREIALMNKPYTR